MATTAQQSSPATALPMLVKKLNSSPSMMSYHLLFKASRNTTFSSLAETRMPKLEKWKQKFRLHNSSNRNGLHLTDFTIENRLSCFNTNFQKREEKYWTYIYPNNTKAQIDNVFITKKWNHSALNWEAFSSYEGVSSDRLIVTAKIRLSLRKNATRTTTTEQYDWALLNNRDIRDKYALALRNKFDALQEKTETHTPNEEYENFVNTHLEAAVEFI